MDEIDPPRVHGLHAPFDTLQYVAAFAYMLFAVALIAIHGPMIDPGVFKIVGLTILFSWLGLSVASYIVAALTPAHDDGVNALISADDIDDPPEDKKSCYYCCSFVSQQTKHCWDCNKCIYHFDHHCRWLNTCIGEKNYKHFAVFLLNTLMLMAIQTGLALFFFIEFFTDRKNFDQRISRAFGRGNEHGSRSLAAILFILFLLEFLSLSLLLHLQGLHVYLFFKRLTTYQWILKNRETAREQRKERKELGMPPGTPTCHNLAVYRFKKKMGDEVRPAPSTKYEQEDRETEGDGSASLDRFSDDGRGLDDDDINGDVEAAAPEVAPSPRLDFSTDEDVSRSSTPNCAASGEKGPRHVH